MKDLKSQPISKYTFLAGLWTALVYITTSIHHLYGGEIYNSPWRSHIFIQGFLPLVVCLALLYAFNKSEKKLYAYLFAVISGVIFVGAVGLWEGGWNHVAKLVYFGLGAESKFVYAPQFLNPPLVQPPKDLFFEASGVLTFILGIGCAVHIVKLLRNMHLEENPN